MAATIRVLSLFQKFKEGELPNKHAIVSTVAKSPKLWQTELSPFVLGPCHLYGNYVAKNMENGWQYSKVYKEHTKPGGAVARSYWRWAKEGWRNPRAVRYPMGKGEKPEYSLWDGKHLGYIEARKQIYMPLYRDAVRKTDGYRKLIKIYNEVDVLVLLDYDAYDHRAMKRSWDDVINDPLKKMGHAFVLAMMLEEGVKPKKG